MRERGGPRVRQEKWRNKSEKPGALTLLSLGGEVTGVWRRVFGRRILTPHPTRAPSEAPILIKE